MRIHSRPPDGRLACLSFKDDHQRLHLPCDAPEPLFTDQEAYGPLAFSPDGSQVYYAAPGEGGFLDLWARSAAGGVPGEPAVRAATANVPDVLADLGCEVVEAWPDLSDAPQVFQARRAWLFALGFGPLLSQHPGQFKETLAWNIEQGLSMPIGEYADACRRHTQLFARMDEFMSADGGFEFMACPTTQVPPFDVEVEYPTEIEGVTFDTYIDWMRSCSDITVTTHPAISVPAGFTADGLPVGLQLVGRDLSEPTLCRLAHAYEQATDWHQRHPDL